MSSPPSTVEPQQQKWQQDACIYEYGSAANPEMAPIPVLVHPPELHECGPTQIHPFDLSKHLGMMNDGGATSPNLMASFIRIDIGDSVETQATATSQAFYVIRGSGSTTSEEHGTITWNTGDMMVVPVTRGKMTHNCTQAEAFGGAALYWIHDQPLMDYLGVEPSGTKKFEPTLYKKEDMLAKVEEIRHDQKRSINRLGVLLGNAKFDKTTKTLTHVLWSLLNSIPGNSVQRPHRHNSVALDLCVSASAGVYTLMGREIDDNGFIIDPIRCDWAPGGVFVTPPGWWHSHHNESNDTAWVLPIQDAGLFTHQRTLDIRFVDDELALHHAGRIRGSAFVVSDDQFMKMKELSAQTPGAVSCETKIMATMNDMMTTTTMEGENPESTTMETTSTNTDILPEESKSEEEEKHADSSSSPMVAAVKRRSSIQVGALDRELTSNSSSFEFYVNNNPDLKSCQSIQVGSDLKTLLPLPTPVPAVRSVSVDIISK